MGNVYVLSRRWIEDGADARQQITVYADNVVEARRLLAEDLRQQGGPHGGPPTRRKPAFEVREFRLDRPHVLTSVYTTR